MELNKVGVTLELSTPCMGNQIGTTGVCVDVYEIGSRSGMTFLFPNGRYDGFSNLETVRFFDMSSIDICDEVENYQFTNVIQLTRDFNSGFFNSVWE